jgi:hypothetical protein
MVLISPVVFVGMNVGRDQHWGTREDADRSSVRAETA